MVDLTGLEPATSILLRCNHLGIRSEKINEQKNNETKSDEIDESGLGTRGSPDFSGLTS